jgi:hypothetical protein
MWRGPRVPGEFPTLGYLVADLIEAKCAIPDGERSGEPFLLTDEMLRFLLHHYRIDPETGRFTHDRGSQLVRPQKWGKGPFSAAIVCAEADPEGPVLFAGWDADGEPVGKPWPTPHIQITAVSEDQTANVFRALLPMIELGDIRADIPDTGKTRINLPSGGLIEPVTAAALSRLGQRITFAVQDQAESWYRTNGGRALADNQRRGLAGMGGRFMETPNAWDPVENSVAQVTAEEPGVYHDDIEPGPGSVRNKAERRKMLKRVYRDSCSGTRDGVPGGVRPWIDLDRIDSEIVALLEHDPAQAERFFLNRKMAGESAAFDTEAWARLAEPHEVEPGTLIVIGVDGARNRDAIGVIATDIVTGYQWPLAIIERPPAAPDDYEHPFHDLDVAMREAFDGYDVWRAYVDPQYIESYVDTWQGRWGDKRVIVWTTNRDRQIAWAVRNYATAIGAGDLSHPGTDIFTAHIRNSRKRKVNVFDERHQQMHTIAKDRHDSPRKIDAAMAAVLSWEARGDAIAAGATKTPSRQLVVY